LYPEKFYYPERTFRLIGIYIRYWEGIRKFRYFYLVNCRHKKKQLRRGENILCFCHLRYFVLSCDYGINPMFRFKTTVAICTFTITDISMWTHQALTSHGN